jgi:hypothetical protein
MNNGQYETQVPPPYLVTAEHYGKSMDAVVFEFLVYLTLRGYKVVQA